MVWNKHVEKWARMSPIERTMWNLEKKKQRRLTQIEKATEEIKEIDGLIEYWQQKEKEKKESKLAKIDTHFKK